MSENKSISQNSNEQNKLLDLITKANKLEFELNTLKNDKNTEREQRNMDLEKIKLNYENEIKILQESNIRYKFNQDVLENENKTLKSQLISVQQQNNEIKSKSDQINKINDTYKSSIDKFSADLGNLKKEVELSHERINERNKSEDNLLKDVKEAIELNKKLKLVNKHNNCIIEAYKEDKENLEKELASLNKQLDENKTKFERTVAENEKLLNELSDKLNKKNTELDDLMGQLSVLNEYKTRTQQTLDSSTRIINENGIILRNNKQQIAELESKIENLQIKLSTCETNSRNYENETNIQIVQYKQQIHEFTETLEHMKSIQFNLEQKVEKLNEEIHNKESELIKLRQIFDDIKREKERRVDCFTQTIFNNYLKFDKSIQVKVHTFETYTQTSNNKINENKKPTNNAAVQCNKLTFTKDVCLQTDDSFQTAKQQQQQQQQNEQQTNRYVFETNKSTLPSSSASSSAKSNYVQDNDLNELLRQSFSNYTNRLKKKKPENNIKTNTTNNNSSSNDNNSNLLVKANSFNAPSNTNDNEGQINTNYNEKYISNKRVRFSETIVEVDDLEENDYRQLNKDF